MKNFLTELGVVPSMNEPVTLLCGNNKAIALHKSLDFIKRQSNIAKKYHILREFVDHGDLKLQKVESKMNTANQFTKALGIKEYDRHKWELGMRYMTDWL